MTNKTNIMVIGVLLIGVIMTLGCIGNENGFLPVGAGEATTVFTIQDAAGNYEELNLDIQAIKLYRENGEVITIPINLEVDLTELENVKMALAQENVPVEQYRMITMRLNRVTAREQGGELGEVGIPFAAGELVVAEDALLEEGSNSVEIDIPIESAIENDLFAPSVVTHVKGGVNIETPEGTQIQVQSGQSVEIQGGHSNAEVSILVGEQGQQQVEVEISEQARERIQESVSQGNGVPSGIPGVGE